MPLKDPEFFDPSGTLPTPGNAPPVVKNASALAGINSGRDYAAAIYAAAYRPLTESVERKPDSLDTVPTAPAVNVAAAQRREVSRKLHYGLSGGSPTPSKPDYVAPSYPEPELPVAGSPDEGNLLLPPPLETPKSAWDPSELFKVFPY